jgi:SH3-like domain-containing protein
MEREEVVATCEQWRRVSPKLFEEGRISSIILQHPRSRIRTMMKRKGKAHVKEHVEKSIKKKIVSKAKGS